jgi:hypothetical protein
VQGGVQEFVPLLLKLEAGVTAFECEVSHVRRH